MCPTAVQTATVAITNGHSVNVAVSSETATNTVYIYSRFSYVFFLCKLGRLIVQTFTTDGSNHLINFPMCTDCKEE